MPTTTLPCSINNGVGDLGINQVPDRTRRRVLLVAGNLLWRYPHSYPYLCMSYFLKTIYTVKHNVVVITVPANKTAASQAQTKRRDGAKSELTAISTKVSTKWKNIDCNV